MAFILESTEVTILCLIPLPKTLMLAIKFYWNTASVIPSYELQLLSYYSGSAGNLNKHDANFFYHSCFLYDKSTNSNNLLQFDRILNGTPCTVCWLLIIYLISLTVYPSMSKQGKLALNAMCLRLRGV